MRFLGSVFFILWLSSHKICAQYYGGYSNNRYWNVRDTLFIPFTPHYYKEEGVESQTYDFRVVLLNDSVIYTKSKIDFTGTVHSVMAKDGKRKIWISPYETKEISRPISGGRRLKGIPTDSCWLFKTESGKINVYSFLAEPGTECVIAIQKGQGGDILPITKQNLIEMVNDNKKALKLAEKQKVVRAINTYNK